MVATQGEKKRIVETEKMWVQSLTAMRETVDKQSEYKLGLLARMNRKKMEKLEKMNKKLWLHAAEQWKKHEIDWFKEGEEKFNENYARFLELRDEVEKAKKE